MWLINEGEQRHEQDGGVDEQAVVEEHRADLRNVAEERDLPALQRRGRQRGADVLAVEQLGQPEAEQIHPDAADPLLAVEDERDDGVHDPHHRSDGRSGEHGEPQVLLLQRHPVGEEGAEQHHAVDTEVEHAAALPERLAESGEGIRRRQPHGRSDGGHEHRDGEELTHT